MPLATLINNNWGGTQEDNSFGTHEFFNLCEMLGIEPYLSVNIGSGAAVAVPLLFQPSAV